MIWRESDNFTPPCHHICQSFTYILYNPPVHPAWIYSWKYQKLTLDWIMFGGFFGILSQFYGSKMIRTCQQRVMWVPGNISVVLSTLPCIRSCFLLTNRWDNHKRPADEPWPDPTGTAWMFFEKWLSIEELSNLQGGSWPIVIHQLHFSVS